jgi:flagellin-specific chaperone FliS|eukprot:SAG31_NODE_36925_length_309_cov_0.728571_1_plen_63_part_00
MIISPLDEQRIKYINHLMDNIHDQSSEIYESLVDKDFNEAEYNINKLISTLNNIKSTFKDEI